jgi:hypothetical protein
MLFLHSFSATKQRSSSFSLFSTFSPQPGVKNRKKKQKKKRKKEPRTVVEPPPGGCEEKELLGAVPMASLCCWKYCWHFTESFLLQMLGLKAVRLVED